MIRRISAMLLAVASLFGAGVVMAAPAQAYCNSQHACFYENLGYTGMQRTDFYSRTSWANIAYAGTSIPLYKGDGVPENVTSIENADTDTKLSVYYNSGNLGPCFMIAAYGSVYNMAAIYVKSGTQANDNMNSHRFSNSCLGNTYDF
ncbi:hypothetical protein [Streptomyces erythrochromogenes]|uniref:hypothetical protein n=1 Tax=Streptomyces erythrochromogenes TaxID=285574 RepID=UPI0038031BF1